MVLKRLPLDVQSIFSASTQIKTFLTAVEELVYNAFDANSTSIAIRVNIQENYIQVVDNGHGVNKNDFPLLGQRYTTSRYEDSITSKSTQKYGHSGQSLANIIKISQSVKITSRHKNSEETWFKHFYNGKDKELILTQARPSVGTTVEIVGFLYNLTIQKKAVNPLQELQRIKTFLEQMSLVHCNTSLSLRDNSDNDIIFKIHKNRDVYQTLSLLLGMEKSNLQELQVEKNQYKVTGFIQKQNTDTRGFQWIFVNKKHIGSSNLHKIINHNLVKSLPRKRITKTKRHNNEEDNITKNNKVPDYFIFITFPHNDYEILSNPKQSMLEFKNCSQINKLLEKLTKFYNGDINLTKKATAEKSIEEDKNKTDNKNTRNQVKMIMDKILGSHDVKINGSQLHNGVKGKLIKRKIKKKIEHNTRLNRNLTSKDDRNSMTHKDKSLKSVKSLMEHNKDTPLKINDNETKDNYCAVKIPKKKQIRNKSSINTNKEQRLAKEVKHQKTKCDIVPKDPIMSKFEKETGEVQKRCQILSKKVDNLLGFKRKRKCKVFTNEYVRYSTIIRDSKKMTIRKKIDEVIIHEYLPLPQMTKSTKRNCNNVMKSDDLLHPVADTFEENNVQVSGLCAKVPKHQTNVYDSLKIRPCDLNIPRLTSESPVAVTFEENNVQVNELCASISKQQTDFYDSLNSRPCDLSIPRLRYESPVALTFEQNNVQVNQLCANVPKQRTDIYDSLNSKPCDLNIPRLTYESHCYNKDAEMRHIRHELFETVKDNDQKFINRVSRDNFLSPKKRKKETLGSYFPNPTKKHTIAKKSKLITSRNCKEAERWQSSYSIYFTESDSKLYETPNMTPIVSDITSWGANSLIGSTYTIIDSEKPTINDAITKIDIKNEFDSSNVQETYSVEALHDVECSIDQYVNYNNALVKNVTLDIYETYCIQSLTSYADNYCTDKPTEIREFVDSLNRDTSRNFQGASNLDVIFISNSQQSNTEINIHKDIDPLRICETIFDHQDTYENDGYNFIFNSINDITNEHNDGKPSDVRQAEQLYGKSQDHAHILNDDKQDANKDINPDCNAIELNNFNLKNRRRYIPKGMSQIFENCNTKGTCNYEFDKDYYEETVYNNFAEDVQINSEVFEPKIQNVKELSTKDVEKINNKLSKDNACLTFNCDSLKQAKVLGQVDYKFIATKIKDKSRGLRDYLVLFDQHAVDERIRLEKNMAEYFDGDQWKSVTLDGISLKLTRDEILYLHNYKKKFHKLGLEWTIVDNTDVSVTAIPEAILGKNARQVGIVLKAVKNLIKEEINMIKEQGGCVSLYPKSIMDLVFSEACRYAIMFGDALSKADCMSLLSALSECKTPFQCAHGRPVMAVLMDIRTEKREYKIDFRRIQQFRRMQNLNK